MIGITAAGKVHLLAIGSKGAGAIVVLIVHLLRLGQLVELIATVALIIAGNGVDVVVRSAGP